MVWFALEYDSRDDVREAARLLLARHRVTGELSLKRTDKGKWLLTVGSEKVLRDSTIEKLNGQRVDNQ